MGFPMLCNWLTIRKTGTGYEIVNELSHETFTTTAFGNDTYIDFITSLDGKTDYRKSSVFPPRVARAILNELKSYDLLRENRWLSRSLSFIAYSLIIPKHQPSSKAIPRIINFILWTMFLPAFVCGLICLSSVTNYLNHISIAGIIFGQLLGTILHEAGHAAATLSYDGGRVFEFGLQITYVFPGAYTLLKNEKLPLLESVQVNAGGVEFNLLLAGIAFVLARYNTELIDFFYSFGACNTILALLNLCNLNGNDGSNILSALLGVDENIVDIAKISVFNASRRSYLLSCGSAGRTTLCAYCIVLIMQIATIALLLANMIGVITWFI